MTAAALIPARYASSRFPGKVLADLHGKPLLWHVYTNTKSCDALSAVYAAIDDERVRHACEEHEIPYIMTADTHISGTSRIAEAAESVDADVIINVQGDEPFIQASVLEAILAPFADESVSIVTAIKHTADEREIHDENVVKVVVDINGNAMYFSRAAIPHHRSDAKAKGPYYKHIGIYAYRKSLLPVLVSLPPSPYETSEVLEQLRWLSAGYRIQAIETDVSLIGVDTPDDLRRVQMMMKPE
jgi:3-deoxy-manno-octulosonate cytidylyltransferase (CMP-KDO synthetase)